ncbi:Proteasome lid subunit RPN8/RPN11, contains Jab1/MPN metalloenzyme (JAMM) motif [Sporobacter termitidis DSM 10068]|uniref:Proteasome lid subunit RPN8/RPN11, contains Jab1/MPN metalloenzyme (JAMM) motif n=1 Tax=Sporobacter termitidis DSM 10068 TaxID=1123282 RepID=A0A1M5UT40_9FIRM|nr:M67 family metallopeptidase [Sporobacter termitidis]SHH66141.1 Proteasome lid subunit RPN8/RPN11, contains Jab1/MPN metalloenzyme (JAMM) motif [Sporobacter termitidis DSM 10068]
MTVKLKRSDYDAIIAHAKAGLPNEACGLIAGTIDGGVKTIEKVYLLKNIDESPEHFSIDPREQLAAVKDMRALGLSPLGNFHSHPETPARPSAEDIRLAYDPKASYLILSLAGEAPDLKAFEIESGAATRQTLVVQM